MPRLKAGLRTQQHLIIIVALALVVVFESERGARGSSGDK